MDPSIPERNDDSISTMVICPCTYLIFFRECSLASRSVAEWSGKVLDVLGSVSVRPKIISAIVGQNSTMAHANPIQTRLQRHWPPLGGPVTSFILLVGLLVVLLGAVLQTGVWAGILGILGFLMISIAVVSNALITLYKAL